MAISDATKVSIATYLVGKTTAERWKFAQLLTRAADEQDPKRADAI